MPASNHANSVAFRVLLRIEGILNKIFGNDLNPFYCLGALGFYFFWIVAISGAYLYAFYKTGIEITYPSVEYLTKEQWYFGGVMRSLHRYASDALVVVMVLHLLREYIMGRYRGARWFSWVTGIVTIWLIYASGINGFWMPWDKLAQFTFVSTLELLDWLPIFGAPLSQSFITQESINARFFSLISFSHATIPLFVLFFLWIHILRISYPAVNPQRKLALGMLLAMLALSLAKPVLLQAPADVAVEPSILNIDWFYLFIFPLMDIWSAGTVWALLIGVTLLLCLMPWLPSRIRQIPVAKVSLEDCSGCGRCVADCPYEAVVMRPRSDGMNFSEEAVVVADRCVSCGICVGACPSSTPFRNDAGYISGIEMPTKLMADERTAMAESLSRLNEDTRIIVFGCDNAAHVERLRGVAAISLPCTAMLPPSFIEYALFEYQADGVFITGCREGDCYHRMGGLWTEQRLARNREPRLRRRVERERGRIRLFWASSADHAELEAQIESFRTSLRERNKQS